MKIFVVLPFSMTNVDDQKYEVTIWKNPQTGHITHESWKRSDGAWYCPTGPALREWDETNGELTQESWHNEKGSWHREGDKPAWIHRDPDTKVITREEYYINGQHHRPKSDGPTMILRDEETGKVVYEEYRFYGELNRKGGQLPAVIATDPETDIVVLEEYWIHGRRHKRIERDATTGEVTKTDHGPEKQSPQPVVPSPL